jgi:hypothetical protein
MLMRLLEAAQECLSAEEWAYFKARYLSANAPVPVAGAGPAAEMHGRVLRKLRERWLRIRKG